MYVGQNRKGHRRLRVDDRSSGAEGTGPMSFSMAAEGDTTSKKPSTKKENNEERKQRRKKTTKKENNEERKQRRKKTTKKETFNEERNHQRRKKPTKKTKLVNDEGFIINNGVSFINDNSSSSTCQRPV
ncbi:hypothetical protein JTB14_034501 [Gonioctena quinquepunctata]|nr:hypothetical protein JTB14_034501 [Gonioctena quinquepunctata]